MNSLEHFVHPGTITLRDYPMLVTMAMTQMTTGKGIFWGAMYLCVKYS